MWIQLGLKVTTGVLIVPRCLMLPSLPSRRALLRLFRTQRTVTLDTLMGTLRTRSRMSVFRRLSTLGYLTSYSHAGRYYTLREIPQFDVHGLWHHQGVSFSRHGSLKDTVAHIVNECEAGRTHSELELALGVRVHNTLLDLVEMGGIDRVPLATCPLRERETAQSESAARSTPTGARERNRRSRSETHACRRHRSPPRDYSRGQDRG